MLSRRHRPPGPTGHTLGCAHAGLLPGPSDLDGDGIGDQCDNCLTMANPDQRDTNQDGFGNLCDADYNNDGEVGVVDWLLLNNATALDPDFDRDDTGYIYNRDWDLMSHQFLLDPDKTNVTLGRPGPSGFACQGTVPCPLPQ